MNSQTFAAGLPGEYLVSDEWRRLLAYYSPVSNPAFMTEQNYTAIRSAFALSLDGPGRLFEVGTVVPVGLYQSAGIGAMVENGKPVESGYLNSSGEFTGVEASRNNNNFMLISSYAINPVGRLSVGANLNFIYQSNFGSPTYNLGTDLGVSYRLIRHPLLGDHTFGFSYQNFLASRISFGDAPSYAEQLRMILHSFYLEKIIESTVEFDITDITASPQDFATGQTAIEWQMSAQVGTWLLGILKAHVFFGIHGDKNGGQVETWGLVGGINAPMINNGRDFNVEYQFRDEINEALMATHSLYIRFDVGLHREEIYARKMSRLANLMPNQLYNKALKLYYEAKYWEAYFVFGQIEALFPDFFKNDMVIYYRGSCMEEMDMRVKALDTYNQLKRQYSKSRAISLADLGIMRIAYRNRNWLKVKRQFSRLSADHIIDSVKFHASYLMGQTHIRQNEPDMAIQYLETIPETHPEYVFAQHTVGVARIGGLNLEKAMRAFENCLQTQIKSQDQKKVYNRSCLFLGYLFYEQNSMSKAVTALRMVPAGSYYYEDALLGLGWCAIKAHQWNDCISVGEELANESDKPVVQYEAALIKAYGLLMQKKHDIARSELNAIVEPLNQLKPPDEDTMDIERRHYERNREKYGKLATKVEQISLMEESPMTLQVADSLHDVQRSIFMRLKNHEKFVDRFKRRRFFARNIESVRQDAEYALAVLEKMSGRHEIRKVEQKLKKEHEDIEKEIDKLEKEMKDLDEEE